MIAAPAVEGSKPVRTTPSSHLGVNLEALFRLNLDEAVQEVLKFDNTCREKAAKEFADWLKDKRKIAIEAKQQLVRIACISDRKRT